ncbi:MAG: thermonuclease family protein [Betaproteobacteria bacterium]|nr:thermonuclease family protein [Betaproteobacteria bacterium]
MRKILFGMLFLLAAGAAQARVLEGRIIEVLDGDTVTVLSNGTSTHRIRLLGIDAPERGQPHGDLAREHLRRLVRGKAVRVEWERMDDYGRIVGVLLISEGAQRCSGDHCVRFDPAISMLREGHAWQDRPVGDSVPADLRARYAQAEKEARSRKIGLWRESDLIPPWEWRTRQRLGILDEVPGRTSVSHSR